MSTSRAARLAGWYAALPPREQLAVRYGAIAAAVLLVAGIVLRLHAVVHAAETRIASKRADVAYVASVLPELRAAPLPAGEGQSLVTVIDRTTKDGGLAMYLRGAEPAGTNGVQVRFEGAAFEALAVWLLRVEREYGLAVEAATLERTEAPGRINANLTLVRT